MISNEISKLLNLDNTKGQIITAELSFKQLIGLLSSLLLENLGEDSQLFTNLKNLKQNYMNLKISEI